jgi:hypothetical protein
MMANIFVLVLVKFIFDIYPTIWQRQDPGSVQSRTVVEKTDLPSMRALVRPETAKVPPEIRMKTITLCLLFETRKRLNINMQRAGQRQQ